MIDKKRRSAVRIMGSLVGLIKPLSHIMILAVLLGTAGYLCAIFLTILAGKILFTGLNGIRPTVYLTVLLVGLAVMRGILHYAEQYCNHYIAFRILAIIRHKVFDALRRLCPAKLDGKEKGDLIAVITSDIELLEVFYAHTISPIAIAFVVTVVMAGFIGRYHPAAGILAISAYVMVGVVIPVKNGRRGSDKGMQFRTDFGGLNSYVLDSLRGLDETIRYKNGSRRAAELDERSERLAEEQRVLSLFEGKQRAVTGLVILISSFAMMFLTLFLYEKRYMDFEGVLICTIAMMGSFGPTAALSALSNNLNQTFAAGERVLSILEEEPLVKEVLTGKCGEYTGTTDFSGAEIQNIDFSYDSEQILQDYSISVQHGKITGIHGASGSGKSTLLKLLMRFWDIDKGEIYISGKEIKSIPTVHLRNTESYMTQETHLFHDSIANNIAVGKPGASRLEIMEAAKKASVHEFILSLPKGYDTEVGELGDTLSGGERQRIGIARAFLHNAPFLLLDEPTSNLDSLNEGIILKSLMETAKEKTVILVSHRESTMNVADIVFKMKSGRRS